MAHTTVEARVNRVVDGDTIRVFLPGADDDESLRILYLDTEESNAGGNKPVTPWGKQAKIRAREFFSQGDIVQLEFPGDEDYATCLQKYRGNYGRLLVTVHKDGVDFQETMIEEGYSPYFIKYGNATCPDKHDRYRKAERLAQEQRIGLWDQVEVNGSEIRNYAALGTWWQLRATIIDQFRLRQKEEENLLDSRLDYQTITEMAAHNTPATVFTELRSLDQIGSKSALIRIGSIKQPFSLFLPDIESDHGQQIVNLIEARYISKDPSHPRRSYAYVSGNLVTYNGKPEIVIQSTDQFMD